MTASTKTLPVALTIISLLPAVFGDPGLLALPSIVCQFVQVRSPSGLCRMPAPPF